MFIVMLFCFQISIFAFNFLLSCEYYKILGFLFVVTFHLKVTGPESMEISWRPPEHPNGIITGYELRRDGEVIYVGTETHYHDFTLVPSVEYGYVVRANNSRGSVSSMVATARTHSSAPSGVGLPTLTPLGSSKVGYSSLSVCISKSCITTSFYVFFTR